MSSIGPFAAGQPVLRRYRVVEQLSGSAASRILVAQDAHGTKRQVVLKCAASSDPERVARLAAEFRILSGLVHPNVVRALELGRDFDLGAWVLVLERAHGIPLKSAPFSDAGARLVLVQIARALSALHARGLLHLDVKPENIVFDEEAQVARLIDFDLSGRAHDARGRGTPPFCAPEVAGDAGSIGPASDLYSLGMTVAAWCGAAPEPGRLAEAPVDAQGLVDPALRRWILELTATDPAERPASAEAFLQRFLADGSGPVESAETRDARLSHPAFAARESELAHVLSSVPPERDAGSASPVAIDSASAGMGKSRLVQEAAIAWSERGSRPILVRPDPGPIPTFGVVRDLFRLLPGIEEKELPALHPDPEVRAFSFNRDASRILAALARERSILVFEDIHRYDLPSREFLLHLIRRVQHETMERSGRPPLELVLTEDRDRYREDGLKTFMDGAVLAGEIARIDLGPLDLGGTREFLRALVSPEEVPDDLPAKLHEQTGGNPLFIRETVLNHAAEEGGGGPLLGLLSERDPDPAVVPSSLEEVIRRRLLLCDGAERSALRIIAIFPGGLSARVLARMMSLPGDIHAVTDSLQRRGLLGPGRERLNLKDAVTRSVVLSLTPAKVRRDLHVRAVSALEEEGASLEEIAYQRLRAGDAARGADEILRLVPEFVRKGQEEESVRLLDEVARCQDAPAFARREAALSLFDLKLARGQVRRLRALLDSAFARRKGRDVSIELRRARLFAREGQWKAAADGLLDHVGDDVHFSQKERLQLAVERFETLVAAGQAGLAQKALDSILDSAPAGWPVRIFVAREFSEDSPRPRFPWPSEEPGVLARLLRSWADLARGAKDYPLALALLVGVSKVQGRLHDLAGLGRTLHGLGTVELARGRPEAAEKRFLAALTVREASQDLLGLADTANNFGVLLRSTGRSSKALDQFALALRLRRQLGYLAGEAFTEINIANVHLERREMLAARRHLKRALHVARRLGDKRSEAQILNNLGVVHEMRDQIGKAAHCYREGEALDRLIGNIPGAVARRINRAGVAAKAGRFGAAWRWIETARRVARRRGDEAILLRVDLALAKWRSLRGQPRSALRILVRLAGHEDVQGDQAFLREVLVEAADAAADCGRGRAIAQKLEALGEPTDADSRARHAIAMARILAAVGDEKTAAERLPGLVDAARFGRSSRMPSLEFAAEVAKAEVAIRTGNGPLAVSALRSATSAWEKVVRRVRRDRLVRGYLRTSAVRRFVSLLERYGAGVVERSFASLPVPARALSMSLRSRVFEIDSSEGGLRRLGPTGPELLRRIGVLSGRLRSTMPVDELLREVVEAALDFSRAERGFLLTMDERGRLAVAAALTRDKEPIPTPDLEISHKIAREALATGRSMCLSNALTERQFASQASVVNLDLRSIACIPLLRGGSVSGLLYLDNRSRAGQFNAIDIELLEVFAAQAASALDNARLARQFARDEKIRVLGNLAGGVAHDFNNLLTVVLGKVEETLALDGLEGPVRRSLLTVAKAARDGATIVRRLQDFSRVRATSEPVPVRIVEIIGDVVEFTRVRRRQEALRTGHAIEVVSKVPSDLWTEGSPSEIREVFTNLVLNAITAMPKGGRISIQARAVEDRISVVVEDTGIGMTEGVRESLFDPYFTTRPKDGVGLGMSIVLGIVLRHRGTVKVDSSPGHGTKITVEMPRVAPAPVLEMTPERPIPRPDLRDLPPGTSRRVVVVDDEDSVRELLVTVLSGAGFEVLQAGGGEEALPLLESGEVAALVTDLGMVPITGFDLAARAREMDPRTAVVLVTGWSEEIDRRTAEARSIDRILPKPFELAEVVASVKEAIERRRSMASLTGSTGPGATGASPR